MCGASGPRRLFRHTGTEGLANQPHTCRHLLASPGLSSRLPVLRSLTGQVMHLRGACHSEEDGEGQGWLPGREPCEKGPGAPSPRLASSQKRTAVAPPGRGRRSPS